MARAIADLGFFKSRDEGSYADSTGLMEIWGGADSSPGILETGRRQKLITQLLDVANSEPEEPNEKPATIAAINAAYEIARTLPSWVPVPEIEADGRGGVSFEWYRSPTNVTVVTTNGPTLHWAALSGSTMARSSGSDYSSGGLPNEPLRVIRRQQMIHS